jgi:hypothetical protein
MYGNYINSEIEIVITKKYSLVYRHNIKNNSIDSYLLYTDGFRCIGICRTEQIPTMDCGFKEFKYLGGQPEIIRYALGIDENYTFASDDEMMAYLGTELFTVICVGEEYTFTFNDGETYILNQHECFEDGEIKSLDITANADNLGLCLQQWHLGVWEFKTAINGNDCTVCITINTLKHMYVFQITNDFIYCRAARYATCNKGVVFDQNFRQNFHKLQGQTAIYSDNSIAACELTYNESLFNPDACVFGGVSIYWSVKDFESDKIYLNGCDSTYIWSKP